MMIPFFLQMDRDHKKSGKSKASHNSIHKIGKKNSVLLDFERKKYLSKNDCGYKFQPTSISSFCT